MSYNNRIKNNNVNLQEILNTINNLPEASSSSNSNNYVHVIFNTNTDGIRCFDKEGNAIIVPIGNSEYDVRGGIIFYVTDIDDIKITFSNTNFSEQEIFRNYTYQYYITCIKKNNTTVTYTYTGSDCCFIPGTKVLTSLEGESKNIECFNEGDTVISYNVDTGETYLAKVNKLITNTNTTDIAEVMFENGECLTMNAYHPIYTRDGFHSITGYNNYDILSVGDCCKTFNGWSNIISINRYTPEEPLTTYNLDVIDFAENPDNEHNDTFYAEGVVVHNGLCAE